MLTKKECIKRLDEARYTIQPYRYVNEALEFAIKELSNPPLKFEEMEKGKWYWDNKYKCYVKLRSIIEHKRDKFIVFNDYIECKYEENRFYRKQVEE